MGLKDTKSDVRKKVIEVRELTYRYPDGTLALDGVDLTVYEGESIALVGPNGAGKSTLIRMFNGIYQGEGKVRVNGLEVDEENLDQIRSLVGMVFQDPDDQLFCYTLYDDVAFGLMNMGLERAEVERRVEEALAAVGLEESAQKEPQNLSFGQKKRAAMATVLTMRPQIMVFDEPTSNLDPKNEKTFVDLIGKLDSTRILISHDMPILYHLCQRVLAISQGKIVRDCTMDEFVSDTELLREYGLDYTFKCADCPPLTVVK
jgi:cobalt/nickel transport system ATP-binding protein